MVPKGWSSVQAQDVCKSISVGVVIKPTQYYVPEGYGVKAFRSANVREGFINDSDWVYFSHEGHAINKKSHLKTGDVLIVRTGYPGTACVVTPEFEGSNAIDIVIARPDMDKIIPEYLCAYTNSHIGKSQVLDLQGGMAQKHLNVGAYQVLKINLPPLREQKKIAQILLTWDNAISVTENLLANSQQQKKALMQQLLTGKKRLLDENGVRFSGEWKQDVNLGSIINISKGVQINKNTLSEDGQFPVINGGIAPSGFTSEFNTDENTITISEGGNSCGYVAFQKKSFWCGGHCYAVRKTALDLSFTFHLLKYNELKIMGLRVGSGLPNIQKKAIEAFTVNFPVTSVEQQKIAAVLSAADDEIATLEKKLACLRDEKKALMQQLLTGKRRVKVDEAVAE
ncbi:restriction endonuclease subunit S [Escherichia coli]|uniref:restriction endonuclease subunit S n=1 Tax=Escherichia coli TaxID=562 RepID=UPI001F49D144|nr:restriction endonuclease subunit S [Escherichia coli]MCH7012466.1 restriction endonuclease subunit S [Escherichia coli]